MVQQGSRVWREAGLTIVRGEGSRGIPVGVSCVWLSLVREVLVGRMTLASWRVVVGEEWGWRGGLVTTVAVNLNVHRP